MWVIHFAMESAISLSKKPTCALTQAQWTFPGGIRSMMSCRALSHDPADNVE